MSSNASDTHGQTAAITGASSGIGAATARVLASEGMNVALGARRIDALEALAEEIEQAHGVQALPVEVDVRAYESVQGFADAVEQRFGGVDLLFANAGTGGHAPVRDMEVEAFHRTIETNLVGAFHTTKAFLPLLEDREGTRTIIFTASVSGTMGMADSSAYCASKWGLRGFAQSLALEIANQGIRTTAINPGFVNTRWHKRHPRAEEMIQPEDIAQLVIDLHTMPETMMLDDVTLWPTKMYSE